MSSASLCTAYLHADINVVMRGSARCVCAEQLHFRTFGGVPLLKTSCRNRAGKSRGKGGSTNLEAKSREILKMLKVGTLLFLI